MGARGEGAPLPSLRLVEATGSGWKARRCPRGSEPRSRPPRSPALALGFWLAPSVESVVAVVATGSCNAPPNPGSSLAPLPARTLRPTVAHSVAGDDSQLPSVPDAHGAGRARRDSVLPESDWLPSNWRCPAAAASSPSDPDGCCAPARSSPWLAANWRQSC